MSKITAKTIRGAAASVRGARSMGIETQASAAAPEILARAERALASMVARFEAGAQAQDGESMRLWPIIVAYEDAVCELRAALEEVEK